MVIRVLMKVITASENVRDIDSVFGAEVACQPTRKSFLWSEPFDRAEPQDKDTLKAIVEADPRLSSPWVITGIWGYREKILRHLAETGTFLEKWVSHDQQKQTRFDSHLSLLKRNKDESFWIELLRMTKNEICTIVVFIYSVWTKISHQNRVWNETLTRRSWWCPYRGLAQVSPSKASRSLADQSAPILCHDNALLYYVNVIMAKL